MLLYLHQSIQNEGGHALFFVVLLKQYLHHRVPKMILKKPPLYKFWNKMNLFNCNIKTQQTVPMMDRDKLLC